MKTLIVYDNDGKILYMVSGIYFIPNGGVNFLEVEIPKNKTVTKIDTSIVPHKPIFVILPKTDKEKIEILEKENLELKLALAEHTENNLKETTELKIALAEITENSLK